MMGSQSDREKVVTFPSGLFFAFSFILLFEIGSDSHPYKVVKPVLLTQENHSSEWIEY